MDVFQVNNEPVAYVWTSGKGTEQSSSTMTVYQLKIGDIVHVVVQPSIEPPNYLYAHYTLFSGYLIG